MSKFGLFVCLGWAALTLATLGASALDRKPEPEPIVAPKEAALKPGIWRVKYGGQTDAVVLRRHGAGWACWYAVSKGVGLGRFRNGELSLAVRSDGGATQLTMGLEAGDSLKGHWVSGAGALVEEEWQWIGGEK